MKLLILSHPYNGANALGTSIARDLDHDFIQTPLDNEAPKMRHIDGVDYFIPRGHNNDARSFDGYNYPDEVPNNTVITHFVKWFKLPDANGKLTDENTFLNDFVTKFDKVLILKSGNIEFNWKSHCAALVKEDKNNYWYKKHNLEYEIHPYEDDMMDIAIYDKHLGAHNYLQQFDLETEYPSILSTDLFETFDEGEFGDMIKDLDIGLGNMPKNSDGEHMYANLRRDIMLSHLNEFHRW
tara:strand:+ start:337 stop:1053 length:717 start_codon:yes stop_codon:yes gene_type:complete